MNSLILNFAIPHNFEYSFTANEYSLKYIGKYKIKIKDSTQKLKNKYSNILTPSINQYGKGIYKGVPLAYLKIQPFKYDSKTNDLWIIDSLDILIDFNKYGIQPKPATNNIPFLLNAKYSESFKIIENRGNRKSEKLLSDNWYKA